MQPNQERAHKLFPDLIMKQPHRESILRKLFLSKGFFDLGELIKTSMFIDGFIEDAKDALKDEDDMEMYEGRRRVHADNLVSGYIKMDVPKGVNPLDCFKVSKPDDSSQGGNRTRFSLELGNILNIKPYLSTYELIRGQKGACVMRRDGINAVEYLLDMSDKKVA